MGERTSYPPGTFSWTDLGTSDFAGAKDFYSELFGWELEDMPAGEGMVYSMARLDGSYVAGIYELDEEQRSQGIPPNWLSYVTVDEIESRTSEAERLGAAVVSPPLDVLDSGRMSLLSDPTGAMFAMWQPGKHIGAQLVNVPGALTMNELNTRDAPAAKEFYSSLFGWSFEDDPSGAYTSIKNGENLNGGMLELSPEWGDVPPHWRPYFAVADCDDRLAKIKELGGQVYVASTEVPAGRFAVVADPQGASFSLFEGELDP
ncbi:MAG: VOC family protein [Actinomycetota bacterium]|nr:VOC family protein [Actinomycetota bacterium]